MDSPTNPVEDSPPESPFPATGRRLSASKSRSRSRSSSSSSLSSCPSGRDSPTTPLQSSGVPFSWEHQPGVPKHLMGTPDSRHFCVVGTSLPPPPLSSSPAGAASRLTASDSIFTSRRKIKSHVKGAHDPFFRALVECSKDQMAETCWQSPKAPYKFRPASPLRGLDRLQISCKTNCAVLESQEKSSELTDLAEISEKFCDAFCKS
ncbi:hypothetical protein EJ110_NYTH09782 [Nymphaea thermarum]|nr:hypothetical protein EJ110_NYTH09782 [Nymphaea thermarum]